MKTNSVPTFFLKTIVFGLLATNFCYPDGFDLQDANMDGVLSGREVGDLKFLDQDGDGEVSRQEFASAANEQRQRAATMVARIMNDKDGNGDGRLSGSEMYGLEYCDANQDRRITESELRAGLLSPDATLAGKSFSQIREMAIDRFAKLDINGDNRLTGTEAHGSLHFDQNADSRISKEEYVVGIILSGAGEAAGAADAPKPSEEMEQVLLDFALALKNPVKATAVRNRMHEELMPLVDLPLLEYAFRHANASHGSIELPAIRSIKKSKLESGETQIEAKLKCQRGQLTLNFNTLKGKTTSFSLDSPEMLKIDKALFSDLQGEELQKQFAQSYGIEAELALNLIVAGKDEQALQHISPSVIEQVGREPFDKLFQRLRTRITTKTFKSAELESFSTDLSEKGIHTFSLTYLVTGDAGAFKFSAIFQRVGLMSVMTGLTIDEALDSVEKPKLTDSPAPSPTMPEETKQDGKWIETVSLENGVSFRMPGKAVYSEPNKTPTYSFQLPEKQMVFEFEIMTRDPELTKDSDAFFKVYRDALVEKLGHEVLIEKSRTKDNFPEHSLLLKTKDGDIIAIRSILDGKFYYRAFWVGPDMSDDSRGHAIPFVDSIQLIDAKGAPRTGLKSNSQNEPAMPPPPLAPVAPVAPPGSNVLPLPIDPLPMVPEVDDGWIQTVSIRERVKFRMPGESTRTEKKVNGKTSISYDLSVPEKEMFFQLEVSSLEGDFSQHNDVFFQTFKNALLNGNGRELLQEALETKAGFPLQVLAIKKADGSVLGTLMMIDGQTLYRAHWDGPKGDGPTVNKEELGMARKFFESIVLIDAGGAPRTGADPINPVVPPPFPTTLPTPAPPAPR